MQYTVKVVRPSGVAHVAGARARVSIRLSGPARHGGVLVNADPVVVTLPGSGEATVDLIPSDQLVADDGRAALYSVAEEWLDPDGSVLPGGFAEWGERFYLRSSGGALAEQLIVPPGIPGVYVRVTDPRIVGDVLAGELWVDMSTGEVKEWARVQTQYEWVPRGHLGQITDQQVAGFIADAGSATAAAMQSRVAAVADAAVAPAIADAQAAVGAAMSAADAAMLASVTSVRRLDAPGQVAVFVGASNVVPGTWSTMVCDRFGWEEQNYAYGGSGFLSGPENQQWRAQADRIYSDFVTGSKTHLRDKVGVVFVAGGGVDAIGGRTAVRAEADYVLARLSEAFPAARKVVVPGLWRAIPIWPAVWEVVQHMRDAAVAAGWQVIEHAPTWLYGRTDLMEADASHPNAAGYARIAGLIAKGIDGGDSSLRMAVTATPPAQYTRPETDVACWIADGVTHLAAYLVRETFTSAQVTDMVVHLQTAEAKPARRVRFDARAGGTTDCVGWVEPETGFTRVTMPSGVNHVEFYASWPVGR